MTNYVPAGAGLVGQFFLLWGLEKESEDNEAASQSDIQFSD